MSKNHKYNPSVTASGGSIGGTTKTYSGGAELLMEQAIAANQTNKLLDLVVDVSTIKSVVIVADVGMTLEFNNSTTGEPTLVLVAGVPYIWNTDSYDACLLNTDITALYVTNTTAGTLKIGIITDPTS